MIGVDIVRVWYEEYVAATLAQNCRDAMTRLNGVFELAIAEAKIHAVATKHTIGFGRLKPTPLGGSLWGWLAIGQVEDEHAVSFVDQSGDRAAHTEFGVVRMWRDDHDTQRNSCGRDRKRGVGIGGTHVFGSSVSRGAFKRPLSVRTGRPS
jgi:hypothetical protein